METVPTRTLPSIRKEIDPATIHRLYHEDNMTITAIAKLCGICPATVRRYLGPVRKGRRPGVKPSEAPPAAPKKQPKPAAPVRPKQLIPSKTELKGQTATFEIDLASGTLYVRGASFELLMTREEVEQFIWELVEVFESIPKPKGDSGGDMTEERDANGDEQDGRLAGT